MDTSETYKKLSDDASPLKPDYVVERVKWYEDPIYIKMCREVNEVQKLWVPINGDFCWHDNEGGEAFGSWEFPAQVSIVNISQKTDKDWWYNWLWLPRQDQLQEMVERPIPNMLFCIQRHWNGMKFPNLPLSMEQLWLAFVMKEKYNKIWDGEEWKVERIC